jgi:sugar lactone lactonase YvrE
MSRILRIVVFVVAGLSALGAVGSTALAKPGDIIVGDSNDGQLLRLKPANGSISVVSDDPRLVSPNDSAFGPDGTIYFADYGAFGDTGAVFAVDPATGNTRVVAKEGPFLVPDGIAMAPNGDLFVTDLSANGGSLFRVKLPGGHVSLVSDAPQLSDAVGIVVPPNGKPIVEGDSALLSVNPKTKQVKAITHGDYSGGDGVARAPDGTLFSVDTFANTLLAVNPATGNTSTVAPHAFSGGYSLGIDFRGRIITADGNTVYALNPKTDANTLLSSDFAYAEGQEVEPPTCGGQTATIVGSTGKDVLKGSKFDDVIAGLAGKDKIKGLDGNDRICGGGGNDDIDGGDGSDHCSGGPGDNRIRHC